MLRAAFTRSHAANNVCPILYRLNGVKRAFAASDALNKQPGILIGKHAHLIPLVDATTFSAASFIPSATMKFNPEFRRIC